jgi:hypothetical protein
MASGKQIGAYSGKMTTITFGPGSGNDQTVQANMEGTFSGELGEGTYVLTHHLVLRPSDKSGMWSQYGLATMKDGSSLGFQVQGTWEEISAGKWRYRGNGQFSDGRTYVSEFEGDWATRTWAGKLYE